ncbi:MAG: lytic transglycosylase domain-containing protein [Bacillota bacterium]|nr:lytic transglycosylase domain-containing protein [Bacillota bacterium]
MEPVDPPDFGKLLLQQWIAANLGASPVAGGPASGRGAGAAEAQAAVPRGSEDAGRGGDGRPEPPFRQLFERAAARYGVDARLLEAVARAESGLDPRAVSAAGALGLMQLMPETARAMGAEDPLDPAQNVEAGARYLKELIDRFGDVRLALAAYNAGPAAVERYGGVPPYPETQAYIFRVLHAVG